MSTTELALSTACLRQGCEGRAEHFPSLLTGDHCAARSVETHHIWQREGSAWVAVCVRAYAHVQPNHGDKTKQPCISAKIPMALASAVLHLGENIAAFTFGQRQHSSFFGWINNLQRSWRSDQEPLNPHRPFGANTQRQ